MNFFYIANARIPTEKAHGLQIAKMCQAFASNGVEVELIIPRRASQIKTDLFHYYGISQNFILTQLSCIDLFKYSSLLGNLVLWLATVSFYIRLRLYLRHKKNKVIYSRDPFICWFFGRSGTIVLELHELPVRMKSFHIKIWQKAKKIVVITSGLKEELIIRGIDADKILVAADAVDLGEFNIQVSREEARSRLSWPIDKKIILYSGSFYLYDWKGLDKLIKTLPELPSDALLVLVGGKAREIEKIKFTVKADNLLLVAKLPHQEMPYCLKAADVLVLPNNSGNVISEIYTSPLKLFEYMASGRPIVASNLSSLRDVLNKNNSILVEPDSVLALAAGIKTVLKDDRLAEQIAKQAFEDVKNHTWSNRAAEIIDFIC